MNVPGMMNDMPGMPQMGHHQTNNTEAGETESSENEARLQQLKANQNIVIMPGMFGINNKFEK